MSNYELTLPPAKKRGGFQKGHIPFNKGKKMSEYMSPENREKCLSGLSRKGNPEIYRYRQKRIVCVRDNGTFTVYESSVAAAKQHVYPKQKVETLARNIRHVAQLKRKRMQGARWFCEDYFTDNYDEIMKITNIKKSRL
jgi:hypothetical protein